MYSIDIDAETILKAAQNLCKQFDVCEHSPAVRITVFPGEKTGDRINLLCKHKDPGLNFGCTHFPCDMCNRKEEVKESNKKFNQMLFGMYNNFTHNLKRALEKNEQNKN